MFSDVNWFLFLILLVTGFIGRISVIPLSLELQKSFDSAPPEFSGSSSRRSSFWQTLLKQNILMLPLLFLSVYMGLVLVKEIGVDISLLEAIVSGKKAPLAPLFFGAGLGILCGVFALLVMITTRGFYRGQSFSFFAVSLRKRFIAGIFHGGFTEELIFRLFLMSLFAWLFSAPDISAGKAISSHALWLANILAAVLFAAAHLPTTIVLSYGSKPAIYATFVINWLVGLMFGYVFWQWGFEATVLAHMFMHVVLQVLAPHFVLQK